VTNGEEAGVFDDGEELLLRHDPAPAWWGVNFQHAGSRCLRSSRSDDGSGFAFLGLAAVMLDHSLTPFGIAAVAIQRNEFEIRKRAGVVIRMLGFRHILETKT